MQRLAPRPGGVDAKIQRAKRHLATIKREVRAYRGSHPEIVEAQLDLNIPGYRLYAEIRPPNTGLSVIIGDFLFDLRSALDHLARGLVQTEGNSPKDRKPRRTMFPILDNTNKPQKLTVAGGVDPNALGLIKRLQPYMRPDGKYWLSPLWIVNELHNVDYGYKLHQIVCAITGLPLAWRVETAKDSESTFAMPLLDAVKARGFRPKVAVMDMGYDHEAIYAECEQRDCHPIIPLRETPAVKAGKHRPPVCEHGEWTFAGADAKRRAAKWRCPTAECSPASKWIGASRLHTLIPRGTTRWKKLYRLRGAVERENGRLKNEWGLLPLRVRRIEQVRLHADLTILARLATALAKART
jgi:hypothetical protein